MPEGLETWVGESGVKVSGGEARRIALARLYLKNAPVLILDEPTEGLDSDTEQDVFNALANFARDKTMIMVTHREAGLGLVDVVYGMERGVLREFKFTYQAPDGFCKPVRNVSVTMPKLHFSLKLVLNAMGWVANPVPLCYFFKEEYVAYRTRKTTPDSID